MACIVSLNALIWVYRYQRRKWGFYNNAKSFEWSHSACKSFGCLGEKRKAILCPALWTLRLGRLAKEGTFTAHADALLRVLGSCYSHLWPAAVRLIGALERLTMSTFNSAQCSDTWHSFSTDSFSTPFPCSSLGSFLINPSFCPVSVSKVLILWPCLLSLLGSIVVIFSPSQVIPYCLWILIFSFFPLRSFFFFQYLNHSNLVVSRDSIRV